MKTIYSIEFDNCPTLFVENFEDIKPFVLLNNNNATAIYKDEDLNEEAKKLEIDNEYFVSDGQHIYSFWIQQTTLYKKR